MNRVKCKVPHWGPIGCHTPPISASSNSIMLPSSSGTFKLGRNSYCDYSCPIQVSYAQLIYSWSFPAYAISLLLIGMNTSSRSWLLALQKPHVGVVVGGPYHNCSTLPTLEEKIPLIDSSPRDFIVALQLGFSPKFPPPVGAHTIQLTLMSINSQVAQILYYYIYLYSGIFNYLVQR